MLLLHKRKRPFECFIGFFTMWTSFMYHFCDSIDSPMWLSEGQWHRLDNIGAIMSFLLFVRNKIKTLYSNNIQK